MGINEEEEAAVLLAVENNDVVALKRVLEAKLARNEASLLIPRVRESDPKKETRSKQLREGVETQVKILQIEMSQLGLILECISELDGTPVPLADEYVTPFCRCVA